MQYHYFVQGPIETNCFIISSADNQALVVDPVEASPEIPDFLTKHNLDLKGILITHSHVDHLHGAEELLNRYNVPLYMHGGAEKMRSFYRQSCMLLGFSEKEMPAKYLHADDLEDITLGQEKIRILTTPGHSPCGLSFVTETFVLTGDLLFQDCIGRYDLPFASLPVLYNSLKKILALPVSLEVLPGHGPFTTLEREIKHNEYLKKIPRPQDA